MNESSSRELAELRALLASHGPVPVLEWVALLCNEAATREGTPPDDVELWECAAVAAQNAAASLGENEDEESDAIEDEGAEDDEDEDEDEELEDAADDEADEPEASDDAADDEARTPIGDAHAEATSAPEAPATVGTREGTTMAKDSPLGPRPANAKAWRCFRSDSPKKAGQPLHWMEGGFGSNEWPIRCCTAETIAERWGDGRYVVQYIAIDDAGRRRPCGRSKVLVVEGRAPQKEGAPAPVPHDEASTPDLGAMRVTAGRSPTSGASPLHATLLPPLASASTPADPMFAQVLSLMAYMNEQNERARAAAAADARAAAERAAAEARAAQERYRAELEAQIERERIASQERIALAQAQAQIQAKAVRATGPLDPEALALKIGEVVGAKLQEARDEDEDDEDDAPAVVVQPPPSPPDTAAKVIDALKETLAPILTMIAANMQQQAQAAQAAAQAPRVDHAAE